jgi:hypothetical protein
LRPTPRSCPGRPARPRATGLVAEDRSSAHQRDGVTCKPGEAQRDATRQRLATELEQAGRLICGRRDLLTGDRIEDRCQVERISIGRVA